MFKCPECDKQYELASLQKHCKKSHKIESKTLYIRLFCNDKEPTCKCGCGEAVKYHTIVVGFSEYAWGHATRVSNNWGHNKNALDKSHDFRRQQIKDGTWVPWNKGETKTSNKSIAAYANGISNSFTDEKRARYSSMLRKNRLSRVVPNLTGPNHPNWNGGVSSVQSLCRSHLHRPWVYPKLVAAGFKCKKCMSSKDLQVHHDQERFCDIARMHCVQFGYDGADDFETKCKIAEAVTQYHIDNQVSGVVLCEACHDSEHNLE